MIAEDAKHLGAQLDTVFEDVQMMWFDGAREPVVDGQLPCAFKQVMRPHLRLVAILVPERLVNVIATENNGTGRVQIRNNSRQIIGYVEADGTVTNTSRQRIGTIEGLQ